MLSYFEFIKESSTEKDCKYYSNVIIRITSRKSIDEIIEIINEPDFYNYKSQCDNTNNWEIYNSNKKLFKIHFNNPRKKEEAENTQGNWYKLKFKFYALGDCVKGMITSDKIKTQINEILDMLREDPNRAYHNVSSLKYIIEKIGKDYYEIYKKEMNIILDEISNRDRKLRSSLFNEKQISKLEDVKKLFMIAIDILLKAIDNGDLDFNSNIIKSLKGITKYNLI